MLKKYSTLLFLMLFSCLTFAAPLPSYEVSIKDGVFSPASIDVPVKQRFKIIIKNDGTGPAEFENLSLRVEKVLASGVSSFVVIHPLKEGSYHFIDEFHMDMPGFTINAK
ncbi:cupredoxin-domain containing protein [Gammaproteobacteria bacterium ESL0073]|uniref:Cupredoxin domain-containing protein n=1 Tax=Entomomonas moraniae TaxID=2213226 RepID=A0A3S9XFR8_9GAMM|nr:cupredoxin domain-containing protein [Entomomonas moraniae]AWM79227.1 cupredoxin-domain containing protein [Gammaproteobacteria bacterium ESL0073]AZS51136.1 cupredoxin domain-containing protein [Entomomonas moraniae]